MALSATGCALSGSVEAPDGGGAAPKDAGQGASCQPACGAGATCVAGRCVAQEAGSRDGSADAGSRDGSADAGSSDGSADAGSSGGGADAGAPLADGGCVGTSQKAQRQPLDLFIMLDDSGSMLEPSGTGDSKWRAVTGALLSFFGQPGMDGTSVGLQFFPFPGSTCPSVGKLCSSDGECGDCGYCYARCLPKADACDSAAFSSAQVEIAPIAEAADKIRAAMQGRTPAGSTPTSVALKGAIEHARAWAAQPARSNHAVVVVLATDGEPTDCDTDLAAIEAIAADGARASPKILTFVIGVGFLPLGLDGIAKSGGTASAFLVDASSDVTAQFLDALNKIRGRALGCSYVIPKAPDGSEVDFGLVNVRYQPGSGSVASLKQVHDTSACASRSDAWYYDDVDNPKQIILCPETCRGVEADTAGAIDVVLGCKTSGPN